MATLPEQLVTTREEYLEQFKTDVTTVSESKLYDFSQSSFLTVLGEAQALSIERRNTLITNLLPYISASLLESIGFNRLIGTRAVVIVRFLLENKFTRSFIIQAGTRFALSVNGYAEFETVAALEIPANIDTADPNNYQYCSVEAQALSIGEAGNQPIQKGVIVQVIEGLDSIWIDEPAKGGNNDESPEAFLIRVSTIMKKFLEQSYSILQRSEFEQSTREILGLGSIAIAVPDISANASTIQLASMHIFALNPDNSDLTTAQKRSLVAELEPKAPLVQGRLYFSSLTLQVVDINVSIKIDSNADSNVLMNDINNRLRITFNSIATAKLGSLEFFQAVHQVILAGGLEPIVTWRIGGDVFQARNLPLPRITSIADYTQPAKVGIVNITIEPSGISRTFL